MAEERKKMLLKDIWLDVKAVQERDPMPDQGMDSLV